MSVKSGPASQVAKTIEAQLALGQTALDRGELAVALEWFRSAARGGDARAYNMLGRCYERGWGVSVDPAAAAAYYRRAADQGDAWAMFNLADLYTRGAGVAQDHAAACALYAEAAGKGHAKSLNMLGLLHEDGTVVPRDVMAAARLFKAAAEGGDCWGAFNLGRLLADAGDIDTATPWFVWALDHGFPDFWQAMGAALAHHPLPELARLGQAALQRNG